LKTDPNSAKPAREVILDRLGRNAVAGDAAYPAYTHPHTGLGDLRQAFRAVLESVGGECWFVSDRAEARRRLAASELGRAAGQVCSYAPDILPGNFEAQAAADVRDCRDVRLAVVEGGFGVAENGAVWVDATGLRHRGLLFLAENLVLVVAGKEIVPDMESAYARIDFGPVGSGYFISGPSKTADIEQCLVVGAHGAKSQVVIVIG